MKTVAEQLKGIYGVEDIYEFIQNHKDQFIQTKWNQYFAKDDSCWMLFQFNSVGNVIGCQFYHA